MCEKRTKFTELGEAKKLRSTRNESMEASKRVGWGFENRTAIPVPGKKILYASKAAKMANSASVRAMTRSVEP